MNRWGLLFVAFMFAQVSLAADVLNCWETNFHPTTPFMTANIVSDTELSNITFNYKNASEKNSPGEVRGKEITSNHSPYKGNVEYILANGHQLILPRHLSNRYLMAAEKGGLGYYKNENGVIIGFSDGDSEGGNHYSYRLSCRSTR